MARKLTAGAVGEPSIGALQIQPTAVISTAQDLDITVDPLGTGRFLIAADAQLTSQSDLRFGDADNSNYVGFQAPATVTTNLIWTLPAVDGTSGQSLVTDGSGTLSFATTGATITDNTADSGTNYVILGTATTGNLTAARVSSTKLTFQPSTGTLTISALQVNGKANSLRPENVQTASYTMQLTDAGGVINMNNSTTATLTVPTNASVAFPIGTVIWVYRQGAGTVTLQGNAGVTLTATGTMAASEELYLRKRDTNNWVVFHISTAGTLTVTGGSVTTAGGFRRHEFTSTGGSSLVAS
jgi:hypothetical protein